MSRDLVRACAIGRAATLRRGPGPAGVRADGLFSPAGWDTPTWAQATCGGRVPTCRANACGGRPAATSVSRPASAHGLRKSGQAPEVREWIGGREAARQVGRMLVATAASALTTTATSPPSAVPPAETPDSAMPVAPRRAAAPTAITAPATAPAIAA